MIPYILSFIAYLATYVLIRWVLLARTRTPAASVGWILAIVFIPILGGLLFILFGINRVERRQRQRAESDERAQEIIGAPYLEHDHLRAKIPCGACERLATLIERACDFAPTTGNTVEIMPDTNRTLGRIEQAILTAEETVHLEYYIWSPDQTGYRLRDLLIERADAGIRVRFLYDSFGSMKLGDKFFTPMRDAGIEVATFSPGQTFRERWSLNLRSHRKIAVIDGRIGFTGGMNIGDEYLGRIKEIGAWRDTHVRLEGASVLQLQQVFAEDWFYATGRELTEDVHYPDPKSDGGAKVQIVAGGPMSEPRAFHAAFFTAIAEAEEEVLLTTSYFIPTEPLAMVLEAAAMRGVRVRLLVPGRVAHRVPATIWAGRSYYESLLAAGVEIYEFNDGMLHAKTLVIDGRWSLVGTPNFDARSVVLNFEVAAVFYDAVYANELCEQFEKDLERSDPVTTATRSQMTVRQQLLENFCRLFAPVM